MFHAEGYVHHILLMKSYWITCPSERVKRWHRVPLWFVFLIKVDDWMGGHVNIGLAQRLLNERWIFLGMLPCFKNNWQRVKTFRLVHTSVFDSSKKNNKKTTTAAATGLFDLFSFHHLANRRIFFILFALPFVVPRPLPL